MRIAMLSSLSFPDHMGGVESYLLRVIPELAKYSEVLLVSGPRSASGSIPSLRPADAAAVRITELRDLNLYPLWDFRRHSIPVRLLWHAIDNFSPRVLDELPRVLDHEDVDIVHTHNVRGMSLLTFKGVAMSGVPQVHTLHDHLLLSPLSTLRLGRIQLRPESSVNRVYQAYTRRITNHVRTVVGPSRSVLDIHRRSGFFRSATQVVLPNPSPEIRHRLARGNNVVSGAVAQSNVSFLFVGTLEEFKGVEVLLRAIKAVPESNVRFHIVGSGKMERIISDQASHDRRIVFHGRASGDVLEDLYRECDVLLFLSLWPEIYPAVISEALSHEMPVVSSAVGGVTEQVSNRNGWLIPPGSVSALAEIMEAIIANRDVLLEKRSKSPMSESYKSVGDHVKALLSIYGQIAA